MMNFITWIWPGVLGSTGIDGVIPGWFFVPLLTPQEWIRMDTYQLKSAHPNLLPFRMDKTIIYRVLFLPSNPSLNLCFSMCHIYLSIYLSIYLYIYLIYIYLSINQSIYLSLYLSFYLSIFLSIYLSFFLSFFLSIFFFISFLLAFFLSFFLAFFLLWKSISLSFFSTFLFLLA